MATKVDDQELMSGGMECEPEKSRRRVLHAHLPQQGAIVAAKDVQLAVPARRRRIERGDVHVPIGSYREALRSGRSVRQDREGFDVAAIPCLGRHRARHRDEETGPNQCGQTPPFFHIAHAALLPASSHAAACWPPLSGAILSDPSGIPVTPPGPPWIVAMFTTPRKPDAGRRSHTAAPRSPKLPECLVPG